jgi:hypothetical protein
VGTILLFIYIFIKLKLIIKETPSLNIVDSSFEHVLYSCGLYLVSTYKYEISNCLFDFISYLLDNHLSSFDTFKSMFIIEYKKINNVVFKN